MFNPASNDPSQDPSQRDPIENESFDNSIDGDGADLESSLPRIPEMIIPPQSYASMYGSRFQDCSFTAIFKLEERVPAPINGGSRSAWMDDRTQQMQAIEEAFKKIIDDAGVQNSVHNVHCLNAFGMIMFHSTGEAADKIEASLKTQAAFEQLSDMTGGYAYIPENPPHFPVLWQKAAGFDPHYGAGIPETPQPGEKIGRYTFELSHSEFQPLKAAIDATLQSEQLEGLVGIDYRPAATGNVLVTCYPSELRKLNHINGLEKITTMEPHFGSVGEDGGQFGEMDSGSDVEDLGTDREDLDSEDDWGMTPPL
jgi:hypothetical protein